ncbi:MAG TPA: Fur family transcriptional regulator [Candidatus Paceibacterota bacterium]|nr:Fur family transcriptional regulator [Candidatus Paceibacterota bacterium]
MKISIDDMLKKADLKATRPRINVLGVFLDSKKPLTAEDVIRALKAGKVDDVTVYRTLSVFERAGLLRKVDLRKDAAYFEMALDHHHHIVCTSCGDLEDFNICVPRELLKQIERESKKFSSLEDHSFEFFGRCKKCVK